MVEKMDGQTNTGQHTHQKQAYIPGAGGGITRKASPIGMQRNFSLFSIMSKTTNDSRFQSEHTGYNKASLVMSPSFKYGLHKKQQSPQQSIKEIVNTKNPFLNKKEGGEFTRTMDNSQSIENIW